MTREPTLMPTIYRPHPWDKWVARLQRALMLDVGRRYPAHYPDPDPDPMDGVQGPDPRPVQTLGELLRKTR